MTLEMTARGFTAGQMFKAGHCAPRGIYECVQTGVLHRLPRATRLPEGGPFRLVASTDVLAAEQELPLFRWPEDDRIPPPTSMEQARPGFTGMMTLFAMAKAGRLI